MPKLKKKPAGKVTPERKYPEREFVFTPGEQQVLKRLGLKIQNELFKMDKPAEWLAFKAEVSRSTLREIIAGRRNPRFLTLVTIAKELGYSGIGDFLKEL